MSLYTLKNGLFSGGGAGAPTDAESWTGAANGSLSAEKSLSGFTGIVYNTAGTPSQATPGTHFLAPDVIDRQIQGSDTNLITIAVNGNSDEEVVVNGWGHSPAGGLLTLGFNNDATAPTYSAGISSNGGALSAAGTFFGASSSDAAIGFEVVVDCLIKTSGVRGGCFRMWNIVNGSNSRELYWGSFRWANTTDNITAILIKGSVATLLGSGFLTIAKRRKFT